MIKTLSIQLSGRKFTSLELQALKMEGKVDRQTMANIGDPYDDYEDEYDDDEYFECAICGRHADLGFDGLCEACHEEFGD